MPAPVGLVGDVVLPAPQKTWQAVRELAGGVAQLLPQSFSLVAGTALGLPPTVADGLSGDVPLVGALLVDEAGTLGFVLGLHVRSGGELVAQLTTGSDARFEPRPDGDTGLTVLERRAGSATSQLSLAVYHNRLLLAPSPAFLRQGASYVVRTVAAKAPPAGSLVLSVPREALRGPVVRLVREHWKGYSAALEDADREARAARGGRAPDYAEPEVALSGAGKLIDEVVAVLESSSAARLVVEPTAQRLDVRATLTPEDSGSARQLVQGMTVGSLEPLGALPRGTLIGGLHRSDGAGRLETARALGAWLTRLLGPRLAPAPAQELPRVLEDLAKGRGDVLTLGLGVGEGSALVVRGDAGDGKALDAGLRGLFKLLDTPAFAEPIERHVGKARFAVGSAQLPGVQGPVLRAKITLAPTKERLARDPTTKPHPIELVWATRPPLLALVLAQKPAPAMAATLTPEPAQQLASEAASQAAFQRFGAEVGFALFVRLQGLGLAGAEAPPALLAGGRASDEAWWRLELPDVAVRAAIRVLAQRQ